MPGTQAGWYYKRRVRRDDSGTQSMPARTNLLNDNDADVATQLAELRNQVAQLTTEVSRLVAQHDPQPRPDAGGG